MSFAPDLSLAVLAATGPVASAPTPHSAARAKGQGGFEAAFAKADAAQGAAHDAVQDVAPKQKPAAADDRTDADTRASDPQLHHIGPRHHPRLQARKAETERPEAGKAVSIKVQSAKANAESGAAASSPATEQDSATILPPAVAQVLVPVAVPADVTRDGAGDILTAAPLAAKVDATALTGLTAPELTEAADMGAEFALPDVAATDTALPENSMPEMLGAGDHGPDVSLAGPNGLPAPLAEMADSVLANLNLRISLPKAMAPHQVKAEPNVVKTATLDRLRVGVAADVPSANEAEAPTVAEGAAPPATLKAEANQADAETAPQTAPLQPTVPQVAAKTGAAPHLPSSDAAHPDAAETAAPVDADASQVQPQSIAAPMGQAADLSGPAVDRSYGTAANPVALRDAAWADKVAGRIATAALDGAGSIDMQLNPPNLGPMHIRIDMTGGNSASVFVTTATTEAARLFAQGADDLSRALSRAHIDLAGHETQAATTVQPTQNSAAAQNFTQSNAQSQNGQAAAFAAASQGGFGQDRRQSPQAEAAGRGRASPTSGTDLSTDRARDRNDLINLMA